MRRGGVGGLRADLRFGLHCVLGSREGEHVIEGENQGGAAKGTEKVATGPGQKTFSCECEAHMDIGSDLMLYIGASNCQSIEERRKGGQCGDGDRSPQAGFTYW